MRNLRSVFATVLIFFSSTSFSAAFQEPTFCNPKTFSSFEKTPSTSKVRNLHMFKVGKLWLSGLAIGNSKVVDVQALAQTYGRVSSSENSCTWYLNKGNREAESAFSHRYVNRPHRDQKRAADEYDSVISSSFDRDSINMVKCAQRHGYIALGCNGMRHRGPSAFAMVLGFAGCSPANSVAIANSIWGSNGVPTNARIAIAQRGFEIGSSRPSSRKALQDLMAAR